MAKRAMAEDRMPIITADIAWSDPGTRGHYECQVYESWRSVAEAAAAVDDDALAGDEPGAFGGQEAHGGAMSPGVPIRPAGTDAR